MELIENADKLHKLWTVIIAAGGVALGIADQVLPALQAVLPPATYSVIFAGVIIARAIKQTKLSQG